MGLSLFFHELDSMVLRLILSFISSHAPSALQQHVLLLSAVHGTVVHCKAATALLSTVTALHRTLKDMLFHPPELLPLQRMVSCFCDMSQVKHSTDFFIIQHIHVPTIEVLGRAREAIQGVSSPWSGTAFNSCASSVVASELLQQLLTRDARVSGHSPPLDHYGMLASAVRDAGLSVNILEILRSTILWRLKILISPELSPQLYESRELLGDLRALHRDSRYMWLDLFGITFPHMAAASASFHQLREATASTAIHYHDFVEARAQGVAQWAFAQRLLSKSATEPFPLPWLGPSLEHYLDLFPLSAGGWRESTDFACVFRYSQVLQVVEICQQLPAILHSLRSSAGTRNAPLAHSQALVEALPEMLDSWPHHGFFSPPMIYSRARTAMVRWLAALQLQGFARDALEIDIIRQYISSSVVGLLAMLRSYHQRVAPGFFYSTENAARLDPYANPNGAGPIWWPPQLRRRAQEVLSYVQPVAPFGWMQARCPAQPIRALRAGVASMRRVWTADARLTPRWSSWLTRINAHHQGMAWRIAIQWSVPAPLRRNFVQLLSAIILAQKGLFTKQCWRFMRTALRIATIVGYIDVPITVHVMRLMRLAPRAPTTPQRSLLQQPVMIAEVAASHRNIPWLAPPHHGQWYHFRDEQQGFGRSQWYPAEVEEVD